MAQWRHLVTYIWVNTGLSNDSLFGATNPVRETMLTYVDLPSVNANDNHPETILREIHQLLKLASELLVWNDRTISLIGYFVQIENTGDHRD